MTRLHSWWCIKSPCHWHCGFSNTTLYMCSRLLSTGPVCSGHFLKFTTIHFVLHYSNPSYSLSAFCLSVWITEKLLVNNVSGLQWPEQRGSVSAGWDRIHHTELPLIVPRQRKKSAGQQQWRTKTDRHCHGYVIVFMTEHAQNMLNVHINLKHVTCNNMLVEIQTTFRVNILLYQGAPI